MKPIATHSALSAAQIHAGKFFDRNYKGEDVKIMTVRAIQSQGAFTMFEAVAKKYSGAITCHFLIKENN